MASATFDIARTNPASNVTTAIKGRVTFDEHSSATNLVSRVSTPTARNEEAQATKRRDYDAQEAARAAARQVRTPLNSAPYFVDGLEKWEGRIDEILSKTFIATLIRATGGDEVELQAEFENRQIAESDHDLFLVGSSFYLTVRTVISSRGYPARTASVRLRRVHRWTQSEIESFDSDSREAATKIGQLFQ
jgi:hypothetical protein